MANTTTFSQADIALMVGVLKQIEVGKVDYGILQKELGLSTKGAAQVRWSRFNSKLKKCVGDSTGLVKGDGQSIANGTSDAGGSPKKRKMGLDEVGLVKDEPCDGDTEDMPRRMPNREGRARKFKEESSEGLDLEFTD